MGRRNRHRGKTFGFVVGNVPHNSGCKNSEQIDCNVRKPEVKRLSSDQHELYTQDAGGAPVVLPNVVLLRPTPAKPTVSEACAAGSDPRYIQLIYFLCFFIF